jgi:hypothetical protein
MELLKEIIYISPIIIWFNNWMIAFVVLWMPAGEEPLFVDNLVELKALWKGL